MKANVLILILFGFAAGQFATLGDFGVAGVLGVVVLIGVYRHFKDIDRLQRQPPEPPPVSLSEPAERDGETDLARRYAGHNGGRHGAHNA